MIDNGIGVFIIYISVSVVSLFNINYQHTFGGTLKKASGRNLSGINIFKYIFYLYLNISYVCQFACFAAAHGLMPVS
jgi:hypothetical protein